MEERAKVLTLYLVTYTFLLKHGEYLWDETSVNTADERVC